MVQRSFLARALSTSIGETPINSSKENVSSIAAHIRLPNNHFSVFLPLSLDAGIYGMNFRNMPELEWTWGYFAALAFMVSVTVGTV